MSLIALSFSSTDSQGWRSSLNSRSSGEKETIQHFESLQSITRLTNKNKLILVRSSKRDLLLEMKYKCCSQPFLLDTFLPWVPEAFMRGTALSLRFQRALIPAYAKMQHGRERAGVFLSRPNPFPS